MIQCLTMTSLKTKNICFLAAFLFLSIVPTLAEVVKSVSECHQFLLEETPPQVPGVLVNGNIQDQNRYKVICQTFKNVPRFLTVYNTVNKIPVFSAYEFRGSVGGRPSVTWMIEPQLENNADQNDINMKKEEEGKTYTKQAVNADYDRNHRGFQKGHLFPSNHASTLDDQISTFTLTNAVPQVKNFNCGRWKRMEQCIKCIMDDYIFMDKMKCFVVVGAKPSDNNKLNNKLNNRVNIPSMLWSAFYCNNNKSSIAGAHWDDNVACQATSPKRLVMRTLQELSDTLGKHSVVFPKYPSGGVIRADEAVTKAGCSSLCCTPSSPCPGQKRPRSESSKS